MSTVYHATQKLEQLPLFPLKQCTQCSNAYPATLDYFHPNKNYADGLNGACRKCRKRISRESAARRRAGEWAEPKQRKGPTMITLICPVCNQEFQRSKANYDSAIRRGREEFFCSKSCKDEDHLAPLPDSIKEEYLAGETTTDIAKRYHASQSAVRRRLQSMGVKIRPTAYANTLRDSPMKGKTHTEEARQKISEAQLRACSNPEHLEAMRQRSIQYLNEGKVRGSSHLEDRVALELSRQGYAFIRQYGINGRNGKYCACVDFMLIDGRAIEVNGTYWHCDPRKYPNGPKSNLQREIIERDIQKMQKLAELGIPLIILWEKDLTDDLSGTIARALATH